MAPVRLATGRLYLLCAKDKVKLTKTVGPCLHALPIGKGRASGRKHSLRENVSRETFCATFDGVRGKARIKPRFL
jgi:hypothetical protein